jgi:hypothetical protein
MSSALAYVVLGTHSSVARHLAVVVRRQSTNQTPEASDGNRLALGAGQETLVRQGSRPLSSLSIARIRAPLAASEMDYR